MNLSSDHYGATVSSQRRLQQLGEDRVSVGDVDTLPAHSHVSQGAAGGTQTDSRVTRADNDQRDEHDDPPDDVPQRGEAQVDGRALLEPIGLRARGALALAAGQVHQVDVGLLGDVLPGEDLRSGEAEGLGDCRESREQFSGAASSTV